MDNETFDINLTSKSFNLTQILVYDVDFNATTLVFEQMEGTEDLHLLVKNLDVNISLNANLKIPLVGDFPFELNDNSIKLSNITFEIIASLDTKNHIQFSINLKNVSASLADFTITMKDPAIQKRIN